MLVIEAIEIVIRELNRRLPKTNKDGFLANDEVYEAMEILSEYHGDISEEDE
tara:strand:+ start:156 stop:311 length:156 start_codon:yes stop_codon:yes gene_type:complete